MNLNDFIKQHQHYNYCEAIIYPNGDVEYANPSHTYKLMDVSGKSRNDLDRIIPNNASPLHYLVGYTKCIAVWYDFFIFDTISDEQLNALQKLVNHDIMCNGCVGTYTDEIRRCELLQKYCDNEISLEDFQNNMKCLYHEPIRICKAVT